jgi:hypothetical protein
VDEDRVRSRADVVRHLADRFEEGQAIDVADRAADLDDLGRRRLPRRADRALDLVVMCGIT